MRNDGMDAIEGQRQVPPEALALLPREVAVANRVCPTGLNTSPSGFRTMTVLTTDPGNAMLVKELQRLTGCGVALVPSSEQDIQRGIEAVYRRNYTETPTDLLQQAGVTLEVNAASVTGHAVDQPNAVSMLENIFHRAITERATDIHIEPYEQLVYVRFRIDGVMYDALTFEPALHPAVISRIKILANLDIAQNRQPQDGRFDVGLGKRMFDVRVSIVPLLTGQKAVLRLLPKGQLALNLPQLGLSESSLKVVEQLICKPFGMVLATGPTGSGKTTTLYACLSAIDNVEKNIITIEDPVEYRFPRIGQIQVNPKVGLTFANGLRAMLRQDPDVILVGEIRDPETLDMAIHSALTGHLVFSTLHCNDAAAAAARMVDMGAEPFLISSAVSAILAQRLVRRICERCKEVAPVTDIMRRQLELSDDGTTYYHGAGCEYCRNTGYTGRMSVFEVVPVSEPIQQAIIRKASAAEIRGIIREAGIPNLRDDGLAKARAGLTSLDEVVHAVYLDIV